MKPVCDYLALVGPRHLNGHRGRVVADRGDSRWAVQFAEDEEGELTVVPAGNLTALPGQAARPTPGHPAFGRARHLCVPEYARTSLSYRAI